MINNLYDIIIEKLTKRYLKKHEDLLKEENELKEKLQNEVTKAKEKLENYLSETNNDIKLNERIQKGIGKMNNEEKNIMKIISYVSKINKTQKSMKNLFSQIMKNINIKYEDEMDEIKYEEYYFNFPAPKNIEIKQNTFTPLQISWNIDDYGTNINKNELFYVIELRKENELFEKIYEGNNSNHIIKNLNLNTNYDIRICCKNKNTLGEWSDIKKFKTLDFDSAILKESKKGKEYLLKLYEWIGNKKLELIFRGTRDGMNNKSFHNKCDNQGPNIVLIKTDKDCIFGGFSSISWISNDINDSSAYHSAPESFLFTLVNMYNTQPEKFVSKNDKKEIKQLSDYGPIFGYGHDFYLKSIFLEEGGGSGFPHTFIDSLGKGKSIFTGDNNVSKFQIKEVEIFKVFT